MGVERVIKGGREDDGERGEDGECDRKGARGRR